MRVYVARLLPSRRSLLQAISYECYVYNIYYIKLLLFLPLLFITAKTRAL